MGNEHVRRFLVNYCRTDVAYAGLKSVVTKEKTDYMHSFWFVRDLKYFYLLSPTGKDAGISNKWFLTPKRTPILRTIEMTVSTQCTQRRRGRKAGTVEL